MDYRYSTYPDGVYMDPEYAEKFGRVYTSTDSPLIPNSITKEILNNAWEKCKDRMTVGEALKESERRRKIFEGGLGMSEFSFINTSGTDFMVRKIAITCDFHSESESAFRSKSNFIANIFDADIEFRTDISGYGRLTAYFRFARKFGESEEKFNNRVYLAEKAIHTYMPPLNQQIQGRCQKSSGRYPWKGWDADFDIYQGINHKTEKLQTIVKWDDGETTTVVCNKYELPIIYPVAYAYCIRKFGSNSAFKRKVKTRRIGDYIYGTLHIEGKHYTASVPVRSKKIDIYDEMAIVFAADIYGGILLFEDMCVGNFHGSKEDDA